MSERVNCEHPDQVIDEALWIAYSHAGAPVGMGYLQAKENAVKEDVVRNARGDGDYVFGRMVKLRLTADGDGVVLPGGAPDPSYQGWARRFETYRALVESAREHVRDGTSHENGGRFAGVD